MAGRMQERLTTLRDDSVPSTRGGTTGRSDLERPEPAVNTQLGCATLRELDLPAVYQDQRNWADSGVPQRTRRTPRPDWADSANRDVVGGTRSRDFLNLVLKFDSCRGHRARGRF
jgi:hypothetical protein